MEKKTTIRHGYCYSTIYEKVVKICFNSLFLFISNNRNSLISDLHVNIPGDSRRRLKCKWCSDILSDYEKVNK